jgi:hypothetical protein
MGPDVKAEGRVAVRVVRPEAVGGPKASPDTMRGEGARGTWGFTVVIAAAPPSIYKVTCAEKNMQLLQAGKVRVGYLIGDAFLRFEKSPSPRHADDGRRVCGEVQTA